MIDVSFLDVLGRYFPMNRDDEQYYSFNPSLNVGGYNPYQSNQQETLSKLNSYQNWANNIPQQFKKKEDPVAGAIGDISRAVQLSQGQGGATAPQAPTAPAANDMQGIPTYSEMYDAYGNGVNILQRLMQMRGGR